MKDKLEEFISGHHNDFDRHEPSGRVWRGIDSELRRRKKQRLMQAAIAASIVLAVGLSIWYLIAPAKQWKGEMPNTARYDVEIPVDASNTEIYYTSLIQKQQQQLSYYCSDYQEVCKDFRTEIDTLDVLYRQLKTEYANTDNNEAVLHAMIENLQEQVKLLSMQLKIIEEARHKNKETKHVI